MIAAAMCDHARTLRVLCDQLHHLKEENTALKERLNDEIFKYLQSFFDGEVIE